MKACLVMKTETRLLGYVSDMARRFPGVWKVIDEIRQKRGVSVPDWPDWCFLPIAATFAIVTGGGNVADLIAGKGKLPEHEPAIMAALAAWRVTQGIYRFDPEILEALWNTPIDDQLPHEVLFRLPQWCVYVETPGKRFGSDDMLGFFAHLEHDVNTGRPELRFLMDVDGCLVPGIIHLHKNTLGEALESVREEIRRQRERFGVRSTTVGEAQNGILERILGSMLSLVLYLCSDGNDLQHPRSLQTRPAFPKAKKTKRGIRLFPPARPTVWSVGHRLGTALREVRKRSTGAEQEAAKTHASPRPHVRRAHWHSYWIGPKKDPSRRRIIVKWLPPIPVGLKAELDEKLDQLES